MDANSNTLIGILNTDTEEAAMRFSLDYYVDGEKKSYDLPEFVIPPRVSEMVDVGQIISSGEPDADGYVIPAGVTFGGYQVRKVGPRLDKNIIVEGLLVDRQKKSFLALHNTGCCYEYVVTDPSSMSGTEGVTGAVWIHARNACNFALEDVSLSGFYSSNKTSVATVSGSGIISFVSPGKASISSNLNFCRNDDVGCFDCIFASCTPEFHFDTTSVTVLSSTCGGERDLIRSEYITKMIPIPACGDFTQTASSAHFSFAEMNGGDYTWAIITGRQLTRLEQTRVNVGNKPISVNSGYRNPVRNENVGGRLLSRHMYGDAADTCPSDLNGDGLVNSLDRDILVVAAQHSNVGFNQIIPKNTCVHLGSL